MLSVVREWANEMSKKYWNLYYIIFDFRVSLMKHYNSVAWCAPLSSRLTNILAAKSGIHHDLQRRQIVFFSSSWLTFIAQAHYRHTPKIWIHMRSNWHLLMHFQSSEFRHRWKVRESSWFSQKIQSIHFIHSLKLLITANWCAFLSKWALNNN